MYQLNTGAAPMFAGETSWSVVKPTVLAPSAVCAAGVAFVSHPHFFADPSPHRQQPATTTVPVSASADANFILILVLLLALKNQRREF